MLRKTLLLTSTVILALAVSSKAQAWGAYRHFGYTSYSPYTGLHHYGYTRAYAGYGGYDRYGYGGYRYGGYGRYYGGYPYGYGYGAYGAARYGYYRAW